MGALKSAYLVAYNGALIAGWSYVLYKTAINWLANGPNTSFIAVRQELEWAQTAAILEVLHIMFGIVRSGLMTTALQVASRIGVLWGVLIAIPGLDSTTCEIVLFSDNTTKIALSTGTLIVAWSLSEIIRYSFYVCKELGGVPYPIQWLRYTAFLVLYPIGVASELTMVYHGMPLMKENPVYDMPMPNQFNFFFSYYSFLLIGTIAYIPGFPHLYFYMLAQRKKVLGAKPKPKAN